LLVLLPLGLFADTPDTQEGTDAQAPQYISGVVEEQQRLTIPLNKSRVIKLPKAVGRVSVANPEIADILVINPREIYLVGKQLGTTKLVVWDRQKHVQKRSASNPHRRVLS
jgi:pilus assembly protein CpaC